MSTLTEKSKHIAVCTCLIALLLSGAQAADFQARCQSPDVIKCVGFDSPSDIEGRYGDPHGIFTGATTPQLDSTSKASGASSLKFAIPGNTGADTSGVYFTNFAEDLSIQFGGGANFFVQWRQRFSPGFLSTDFSGGGWKQIIIGTGDQPGCTRSSNATGYCYSSCTALEVVSTNGYFRNFPQMYNSCTGSTSHGPYEAFNERLGAYDFKLQNARPEPYCLYSQGKTNPPTYFPPAGNCLGYVEGEWMTFQIQIQTGPRLNDEFVNSYVRMWAAREGQPSELAIDWGPYNLTAGDPIKNQRFGKVWLLPYNTGKDSNHNHPTAYTWYDELIISTSKIADPTHSKGQDDNTPPAAPTSLKAN